MKWVLLLLATMGVGVEDAAPKGHLVIVGGGSGIEPIRRRALELAGGARAKVLVVPHASRDPDAGRFMAERWRNDGATHVEILDLSNPETACSAIRTADLIWMRGGDQTRLIEALVKGGVCGAIQARYQEGATIGGTSAGAAVMSRLMIAGEVGPRRPAEARKPRIGEGLGLWPEVIVDQHFLRRRRMERLTSVVLSNPSLLGVGIDESTAVIVSGLEFEVVGQSDVIVLDAREPGKAAKTHPDAAGQARNALDTNAKLKTITLKAGMKYHIDKGVLIQRMADE